MKLKLFLAGLLALGATHQACAQSELYPKHFDLEEVTLLDGPMKTAMELNIKVLLQYDVDRLLTPYVRQAGLASTTDKNSPYYQWLTKRPNFKNWGGDGFDLSGHVGGHYLSALALAYAASHDAETKKALKERMEYMLSVMKDCQDAYDNDTEGLYGFIGGQPINDSWKQLYKGDLSGIQNNWGWVPFYCQHKILAGLRDAYLYGNNETAKEMFRKLSDWSVNLIAKVDDQAFEGFLNCEHGGMNESMLDAYQLFGDQKYLTAAKKYTHKAMLNGMQTLNTPKTLRGRHVLLTAGPTVERLDPVRYLSNFSTGKMGYALARECLRRGAEVTLVSGPTAETILGHSDRLSLVPVGSAREMCEAAEADFPKADLAILCAAVADYRPAEIAPEKIKKQPDSQTLSLLLVENPDIAARLGECKRQNQLLVGFALETEHEQANAMHKMARKRLDYIVLNSLRTPGAGFATDTNCVTIFSADGTKKDCPLATKQTVAQQILDTILFE